MLRRKTFKEVGGLAVSITFVAAVAVLAITWHMPQPSELDSLTDVLSMEARMNTMLPHTRLAHLDFLRKVTTILL